MSRQPYSIPGALVFALLFASTGFLPPGAAMLPPPEILASVVIPFSLLAIPLAYWLPIARASSFGSMWHVPSQTFLLPRFLVCLIATSMIGAAIGSGLLGIWDDYRYLILSLGQTVGAVAFTVSAVRRFRHHPMAEFVMPSPIPFPLRGRM